MNVNIQTDPLMSANKSAMWSTCGKNAHSTLLTRHVYYQGRQKLARLLTVHTAADTPAAVEADAAPREKTRPRSSRDSEKWVPPPLTSEHLQRNAALVEKMRGKLILAPLTRGTHLPFRRLCADFGADVTMGEMAFARHLLRGDPKEKALLKRADNEVVFAVQIATNMIDEGVKAGLRAAEAGADFVDLNCGCPIYEATRRGLGSSLLRKPGKLQRLVAGIASQLPIPLTVKVRLSASGESNINIEEIVTALKDAGAAVVTIHGRTALQRYKRAADWSMVENMARTIDVPIVGNGDVLTPYEAEWRMSEHGCLAVMVGRGALMKPWIFQEFKERRELNPDANDRVGIYRNFVSHMKEHFGDDVLGKRKGFYFLPWHLGFFARYRPLPESFYAEQARIAPLISTRWEGVACPHENEADLGPLEQLLRCEATEAHDAIAEVLWESSSDQEAIDKLTGLSVANLKEWQALAVMSTDDRDSERNERETEG